VIVSLIQSLQLKDALLSWKMIVAEGHYHLLPDKNNNSNYYNKETIELTLLNQ